ncbi:MAG: hypothetical protein OXE84_14160 [Rhodobacteraceae bacterium]|nr:hypothetical protein [Paracoccaceae bacterium]
MQVIYGVDSRYVLPALVSAYSAHCHASHPLDITIFGDRLNDQDRGHIQRVRDACGGGAGDFCTGF